MIEETDVPRSMSWGPHNGDVAAGERNRRSVVNLQVAPADTVKVGARVPASVAGVPLGRFTTTVPELGPVLVMASRFVPKW